MDLLQVRSSFETLKTLRQMLNSSLPELINKLNHDQLIGIREANQVSKSLDQMCEAQASIYAEVDDPTVSSTFTTMKKIEEWLSSAENLGDIKKFLRVEPNDTQLSSILVPYMEKVHGILDGTLKDDAFTEAALIFVDFVEHGCNFGETEKINKLSVQFSPTLFGLLCANQFHFKEEQVSEAQPMGKIKVPEVIRDSMDDKNQQVLQKTPELDKDRHPIKVIGDMVLSDTLEVSGSISLDFNGKEFGDTMTRNQPAKKIISALAKYYVLSAEQLKEIVCIDGRKINNYLLQLSGLGYINKFRYKKDDSTNQIVFTIGKCCTQKSPRHVVAQHTNTSFVDDPAAAIWSTAVENYAALNSAMLRSEFLRTVEKLKREVKIVFHREILDFGRVCVTGEKAVWFYAPYLNEGNEKEQLALLKAQLKAIPEEESIILYVSTERLAGDWNIALADAKISLLNIYYLTENGLLCAHGLESINLEKLLFDSKALSETVTKADESETVIKSDPKLNLDAADRQSSVKGEAPSDSTADHHENLSAETESPVDKIVQEEVIESNHTVVPAEEGSDGTVTGESEKPVVAPEPVEMSDETPASEKVETVSAPVRPDVQSAAKKAKSARKTVVIDINKLPELPVRNNKVNQHNGIFKGVKCPGEDGDSACVKALFQMLCQGASSSALLYARSMVRCVPDLWSPVYTMLAYAYNDPLENCLYDFITIQAVYDGEIAGCSVETVKRYELCAFLRMLFSDQLDMGTLHLMKAEIIEKSLNNCELLHQISEFHPLLEELCGFIQKHQRGFGAEAANRIQSVDEVNRKRKALQERAKELLAMRLDRSSSRHGRVKSVRESLFGINGSMTALMRPVAEGQTEGLEQGIEFCRRYQVLHSGTWVIDPQKVNKLIDELWNATSDCSSRMKNDRLLDTQKIPIGNYITEHIRVFTEWVNISAINSRNAEQFLIVRNHLLKELENIENALSGKLGENASRNPEDYASKLALLDTIAEEKEMLVGKMPKPELFYVDFLTSDHVELDPENMMPVLDESVSIIPGYELWTRVQEHEQDKMPLSDYIEEVLSGECMREFDFGRQLTLLHYLRTLDTLPENVSLDAITQIEDQIAENVEAMPPAIQRMEDSFNAEMEMAEGYGRFVDLGTKDRILHEMREWYRPVANHSCNYGFYQRKMDACCAAVEKESVLLKTQYIDKLEMLRSSLPVEVREKKEDNILNTIAELIDNRVYSVADDYMRLAEQGHTAPPVSYMRSGNGADYFESFVSEYDQLFRSYGYDAGRGLYDVYNDFNPEYSIRNKVQKDAHIMLRSWPRSVNREYQEDNIRNLLTEIGLAVERVITDSNPTKKLAKQVRIFPAGNNASEYEHPIAEFGSKLAEEGLTVQLIFGRTDPDNIMNMIRSYGSVGNPIMILLDYSLSLSDRRAFAAMLKREGANARTVILIDRILAVFLAGIMKSERVKAMLQCTLPFDYMIPYKTDDGASIIPPEMFMGRRDELRSILNPGGTHIIYGGRQLGKSALLHRAKAQMDNRKEGYWGIYINILKKEADELPAKICKELIMEKFLDKAASATTWTDLCDCIRIRMNEDGKPVKYLLLLLDEADAFLRSCEKDEYSIIEQLLQLQTMTNDRFKFVLAGLHNVLRYSKKAVDNNQSLNRLAPTCIKPLKYSEGSELLEKPLFYLGFRMKPEHVALISQILSSCNYYPGLIHYYAYQLLTKMELNTASTVAAPPYYLDEAQIRNLLQDSAFNEQIKKKLDMTLGVDAKEGNHYRILAYALAYCFHEDSDGAAFGFTAAELMHVCGDFEIAEIVNLGEYTVQALLEEMVELNVLRASFDKKLFSFNRRSFLEMLGDEGTVWNELEGFGNVQ